jgi:hypothetical protein
MTDQLEREELALEEQLNNGEIGSLEYNRELQALHREYREAAREAAQDAYDRELDRW